MSFLSKIGRSMSSQKQRKHSMSRARSLKTAQPALPPATKSRRRLLEADSEERKRYPIFSGVMAYFPDALAGVAEISFAGNEKHNPGMALHWARGKSMDHKDCIARHLIESGGFEDVVYNGKTYRMRHSAALAWRALANLQEELEAEFGLATPPGARDLP